MSGVITIGKRDIGEGLPVYIVAELSANHKQSFEQAIRIIQAAKESGADAIKLQTYTADTITIRSDRDHFRIRGGTLWDGRTLYDLYTEAFTPWEWQPKLKHVANDLGMELFSSAFDATAVDFLEKMKVPAHKIASCELVDIPLIQKMARTGKPLILSTGMATVEEIQEAIDAARSAGARDIVLLKCTSEYPASPDDMNLRAIPELAHRFCVPIGLSDHTPGIAVAVASVSLGTCVVEKHLTLSRQDGGPDAAFSLEPAEFKAMTEAIRIAERALGKSRIGPSADESAVRAFRRSLFVVEDMRRGDEFTASNVRSIRPSAGLHPRHLQEVLGRHAATDIERGTPLSWNLLEKP